MLVRFQHIARRLRLGQPLARHQQRLGIGFLAVHHRQIMAPILPSMLCDWSIM